jgi:hypothetical protein
VKQLSKDFIFVKQLFNFTLSSLAILFSVQTFLNQILFEFLENIILNKFW